MDLPHIKLCTACSTIPCDKDSMVNNIDFIDWETYKDNNGSSEDSRCDLVYDNSSEIFFIELKTKDWFCETKKLKKSSIDFYTEIYSELYKKIKQTLHDYNVNISDTSKVKNLYSIVFSKSHGPKWDGDCLTPQQIITMLRNRIFCKFPEYDYIQNTFQQNEISVYLDARECSMLEKFINRNRSL